MQREDLARCPLADLARLDDAAFRARFAGTPIKRAGRDRFVRNVLIAIGNSGNAGAGRRSGAAARRCVAARPRDGRLGGLPAAAAGTRSRRLRAEHRDGEQRRRRARRMGPRPVVALGCRDRVMKLFVFGLGYTAQTLVHAHRSRFAARRRHGP